MSEVVISAAIPEELHQQLVYLAKLFRRDPAWLIEDAIRSYIARETKFAEAVDEGIRADDAGEVVPHEVVMKEMEELIESYRSKTK